MKINKIELFNLGPYKGLNIFDLASTKKGSITVIGGKNGAGKTTLFTSIRLCLHGYREGGYAALNGYYKKKISKLVNDGIKFDKNSKAYVALEISLFNGQDWDQYRLSREWHLRDENFELFSVNKNGVILSENERDDFENYLLNIIPPELFNLYFFDGEKIADFFLNNNKDEKIKSAFMTICGYDTFDVLYKNIKSKNNNSSEDYLGVYFEKKDCYELLLNENDEIKEEINTLNDELDSINADKKKLEKKYSSKGGVSIEEWNQNFIDVKTEERIREEKNSWIKSSANDIIPYIILKNEINELVKQIDLERELERQKVLFEVVESIVPGVLDEVSGSVSGLTKKAKTLIQEKIADVINKNKVSGDLLLNLSGEERITLSSQIALILSYKKEDIIETRNEIKKSIKKGRKSREQIEKSSISEIDEFLKEKESLIESSLEKQREIDEKTLLLNEHTGRLEKAKLEFKSAEKNLENKLKSDSVENLSAKLVVFLDSLQKKLYDSERRKVEEIFSEKIDQLKRKDQLINCIKIDDDFTVHAYKNEEVKLSHVKDNIIELGTEKYHEEHGDIHCNSLLEQTGCKSLKDITKLNNIDSKYISPLIEFNKNQMSQGEKQVFIMALYWSIMQLSNKEVPFIIDTPFARIDTDHREHITKYFFKELKGQVLIFSTDSEITNKHLKVIGSSLQKKFLVKNTDNIKTTITPDKYFGE